ncbi:ABC transporter substrate-binding protein [Paenarthrobacter nicotinovorans]|uniref:glutamate ABC transporter substrate-binding protein n=1 Tax=Paenarthrobacter nicotinovorans TaxID=29320 RepID=UPI0007CC2744|nr:glutamate ABC transporter substrate-binding protein [Paenarthrobacter nicotinovorans]GAT89433.1 ABC transporter substrate-binding protein [Paenarthrobacter nicotinovorans]
MKALRNAFVVTAVLAVGSMLASCSSGVTGPAASDQPSVNTDVSFPSGSTMQKIHDSGKITIGTKFDQPLFGLKNPTTGQPQGFDAEIGRIVAARLGIPAEKIQWVETVSANREPFLQQGRVDLVVATYTMNAKRAQVINFAGPYYVAGQSLMVQKGNPLGVKDPKDLAGRKACSVEGSASSANIRTVVPTVQVITFDSYSKCADALKNGQVDAVTTDNTILAGLRSLDPDSFDLVDVMFTKEPYGIGVAKDRTDLAEFADEALKESFSDGSWAKAWDSTAGKILGAAPEPPVLGQY